MIWYFDKDGFHEKQNESNTRYEVTQQQKNLIFQQLNSETEILILEQDEKTGAPYIKNLSKDLDYRKNNLRLRRKSECFSVINRGFLWYQSLTETQINELKIWYKQWLDVTINLSVPNKPEWLK